MAKIRRNYTQKRYRAMMRGYRILKSSGELDKLKLAKEALTNAPLFEVKKSSSVIYGCGAASAEIICKQYLLTRIADIALNKKLLYSIGKPGSRVIHYIPSVWRKLLREHGFNVSEFRSELSWRSFQFLMIMKGIALGCRGIISGLKKVLKGNGIPVENFIYFSSLTKGNLPFSDKSNYDIISWYDQWKGRDENVECYYHSVPTKTLLVRGTPVKYIKSPIALPAKFEKILQFSVWLLATALRCNWDLLRGYWWHPVIFSEAVLARIVGANVSGSLGREYLFNNAVWLYRPLWTYEAERLGSRIILYFYSTNVQDFKKSCGYPLQANSWQILTWPVYLVWDKFQVDFLRRIVNFPHEAKIVGPIWFSDSVIKIPVLDKKSIAVFDITPHRMSRYITLGLDMEYYIPEICNKFLADISAASKLNYSQMVWKQKRKIGATAHSSYRFFTEQLASQDNMMLIDPDISAFKVIQASNVVVSMPFTSTAIVARTMGKPTCYYDPSGLVQKDDRAAHGILIVSGIAELSAWLYEHLAKQENHSIA